MTGLVVTATGWTIQQLDATPWPAVMDLIDYWADNPPVHRLVAAYLGVKPKRKRKKPQEQPTDLQALVNLMNGL